MKIILLIPIFLFLKFQQNDEKLNGKYRVISEQYESEYVIFFNDSVYRKVYPNGKQIKGVVEYKNLIYLRDYESSLKVVGQTIIMAQTEKLKENEIISLRKQGKDTLSFCIHRNGKDTPMDWLEFCQGSGKLIRVE